MSPQPLSYPPRLQLYLRKIILKKCSSTAGPLLIHTRTTIQLVSDAPQKTLYSDHPDPGPPHQYWQYQPQPHPHPYPQVAGVWRCKDRLCPAGRCTLEAYIDLWLVFDHTLVCTVNQQLPPFSALCVQLCALFGLNDS